MIDAIITYDSHDFVGDMDLQFNDVEFKVDFGPWKKGQKVDCLCLLEKGILAEYSTEGKEIQTCQIKIVPK